MNEVIELAKKCGLSKHEYRVGALVGYEITIQAFYEAAIEIGKAQGAKEFMEALGEPAAYKSSVSNMHFSSIGITELMANEHKFIALFALPTKDEVK